MTRRARKAAASVILALVGVLVVEVTGAAVRGPMPMRGMARGIVPDLAVGSAVWGAAWAVQWAVRQLDGPAEEVTP
jgi:hypothetical protein